MKLSEQKLEQAKKLLFEIQVYFDTISEFISAKYVEGSILDIADKILKSIEKRLNKYSSLPIERKKAQRNILKSIRIKYLYLRALLIALQRLNNNNDDDYPADKITDFSMKNLELFYDIVK